MTRNEKEQRIQKKDGKVFGIYNVEIHTAYRNPKYSLSKQTANEISSTGRLNVFEINPLGDGPSFTARWDGGSRDDCKEERYDLKIDIGGVSDEEKRRFKHGQGGYSGHHTIKVVSNTGRAYQVSIGTPDEMIFEGTVCFNVLRKLGFEASIQPGATLDTKIIRAEN